MARSTVALALLGLLACAAFAMADDAEMQRVSIGGNGQLKAPPGSLLSASQLQQ
jgi:hypothetical protein